MLLDDLVSVIETLQRHIKEHGDSLKQNEFRTRVVLIDPLLKALGWDVSDPSLVTLEHDVSGQRADYALLNDPGKREPAIFIEAKKLGESLNPHRMQMVNYANMSGVPYAGLTDGNKWELYNVFEQKPLSDRLILDLSITVLPDYQCALQFLLLWRSNLASGQPINAKEPIFSPTTAAVASPPTPEDLNDNNPASSPLPPSDGKWVSLSTFEAHPGSPSPVEIRFSDGKQQEIKGWRYITLLTVQWLWEKKLLTSSNVPVQSSPKRYIVNTSPQHPEGNSYNNRILVDETSLFMEGNISSIASIVNTKTLLRHCDQDPATVWVREKEG